jgi:hypothetical protein
MLRSKTLLLSPASGGRLRNQDILEQRNPMKKLVIAAAAFMASTSAHAGTYGYEGITVHVQDGCRPSSCVAVYAPGYGYYQGGRPAKVRQAHKDTSRIAAARKEDATPASAAPAVEATPAKTPEAAAVAALSDAATAK